MKNQSSPGAVGNAADDQYLAYIESFRNQFLMNTSRGGERLFTTDADPDQLWEIYLSQFDDGPTPLGVQSERQHHNCHACRHFIQRYGGLVTIDERGRTTPVLWHAQDSGFHPLTQYVARAKVTGVFFTQHSLLGTPVTGQWRHLSIILPGSLIYVKAVLDADQAAAEKREDFKNICRALDEFPLALCQQAMQILSLDALYRSEKVMGPCQFLLDLHQARSEAVSRANITWRLVASAPAGFCHPRSSMIGTLLEDLQHGGNLDYVIKRFAQKMHPLQYQRPQAPPKPQAIDRAEKIIADLGLIGSLRRRFARLDEVFAIWRPNADAILKQSGKTGGVFDHLRRTEPPRVLSQTPRITWEKFRRDVLPGAIDMSFLSKRHRDNYGVLVTAADGSAPPIMQWDSPENRNPFSSYVWHGGSSPSQYGLRLGDWHAVSAITLKPSMWYGADNLDHQGKAVFFLLRGARETIQRGAAIFPENLRSELHGIRSVIEAHSKSSQIEGISECSAVGIMLTAGVELDYMFRVMFTSKIVQDYIIDRWD